MYSNNLEGRQGSDLIQYSTPWEYKPTNKQKELTSHYILFINKLDFTNCVVSTFFSTILSIPRSKNNVNYTLYVTPYIPLSDDVTSHPSRNVSIRSRTAAVKSSHFRSPSSSPTRLRSVKAMKFKAQNPTLKNFTRSRVKLS